MRAHALVAFAALVPLPAQGFLQQTLPLTEGLMLPRVGRSGRVPVHTDALEARIVRGEWETPESGAELRYDGRVVAWESARAGEDGWFQGRALRGGYLRFRVPSESDQVAVLHARGHGMVWVNGEPRAGDVYANDLLRQPVLLRAGDNELLFQVARGRLHAVLEPPPAALFFQDTDRTLPDLLTDEQGPFLAGVIVCNASTATVEDATLEVVVDGGVSATSDAPRLPPLATRKVAVAIPGPAPGDRERVDAALRVLRRGRVLHETTLSLRVRSSDQRHLRTFESGIDGSVQYYAVNPARPVGDAANAPPPALVLSLHGASVEASGQAAAYADKSWAHLVAPTNRRPYGFDWEDWGRIDALEALADAQEHFPHDPSRVYLTGHSMGGHGTWHLGVNFPDRFAAIGPSAGWISFWSYGRGQRDGEPHTPMAALLQWAAAPGDTLALSTNLRDTAVYVLHGEADDNVPVRQARTMVERLRGFHEDLHVHEQPGAGHWWDDSDAAGAGCVDWPPMFDLFARRRLPPNAEVRDVDFATHNPGISARRRWVTVECQHEMLLPARVNLRCDPIVRRFTGTTDNVLRLALDLRHLQPGDVQVVLDGQDLGRVERAEDQEFLHLSRAKGAWSVSRPAPPEHKGPHRYGPFKAAFDNRMVFVHGTAGSPEENAWALAKARFDAETFQYRGNGSVDVLPDTLFLELVDRAERNAILYGNADTNAAWPELFGDSPVQVSRGELSVGERTFEGDDLAAVFVRPVPGTLRTLVAVVAGTGLPGMRATDRLRYFVSGASYPDFMVFGVDMLERGEDGVRAAGWFGPDWRLETGEVVIAKR